MNRIEEQIRVSKLLAAKTLGQLTVEEEQFLKDWEEQAEDNKAIAKEILQKESYSKWESQFESINTRAEWSVFVEKMNRSTHQPKIAVLKYIKWVASIAAVLVVGFGIFFAIKSNSFNKEGNVPEVVISPGKPYAELVLSSGEVIDLTRNASKKIKVGNIAVHNHDGILHYQSEKALAPPESKMNTVRVPRGAEYQLELADGTRVWLNSESEISFPVPFNGNERKVMLKGEAYFEVAHNAQLPFRVVAGGQEIEDLGTKFNVSAYKEDSHILTTLVQGKVRVKDVETGVGEILKPGEQSLYNKQSKQIQKATVDTYPYTAWKDGRFVFDNVSLEQFLTKVSRWYDVDIAYENDQLKELRFTGDIPKYNSLNDILKILEEDMSVHIKIENSKKIYVYN